MPLRNRRHAQAMLGSGVEFIEEVGIDSDACGDDEVASAGLPFEILVLNMAQGYAARLCAESRPRGAGDIHGQPRSWASALAVPMGRTASATPVVARTWMML